MNEELTPQQEIQEECIGLLDKGLGGVTGRALILLLLVELRRIANVLEARSTVI
jgi:hypothetical protein